MRLFDDLFGNPENLDFNDPLITKKLTTILGESEELMFHAPVAFNLGYDIGGRADVYMYKKKIPGVTYLTGDLFGSINNQKKSDAGNYELMICHKEESQVGINLISKLAYYTLEASIHSGETMNLGPYCTETIKAVVFDKYAEFEIKRRKYGLMLLVGITEDEFNWKQRYGGMKLISLLKTHGIYPYTDWNRESILNL